MGWIGRRCPSRDGRRQGRAHGRADAREQSRHRAAIARASPEKVEDAKKTAKAAKLTPIVPSPQNPLRPAFQLYAEIDLPILGIGLVFEGARLVRPSSQKAFCAPLCPRSDLNALDRTTAGYWSPGWQTASDYGLYTVMVAAATLLFADEGFLPGLNDAIVVAESALAATAAASVMTLAAGRPRPFLYGEKAPAFRSQWRRRGAVVPEQSRCSQLRESPRPRS